MAPLLQTLHEKAPLLSVGAIAADLSALGSEVKRLEKSGVYLLHFDVMDGVFCPGLTLGLPVIKAVKTSLFKDVHLMIQEPAEKVKDFVAAGADMVTIHVESERHIHRALQALAGMENANEVQRGILRGVALNPGTPLEVLDPLLDEIDLVLLLAVNPGWVGQRFISSTLRRIGRAQEVIAHCGHEILLGVDGGITQANLKTVAETGVDWIITGSAVFAGGCPEDNARNMLNTIRSARSRNTMSDVGERR